MYEFLAQVSSALRQTLVEIRLPTAPVVVLHLFRGLLELRFRALLGKTFSLLLALFLLP